MSINVKNRTIFTGDNLDILRGINSNSVDLIYLDPPFNTASPLAEFIESQAQGKSRNQSESFKDIWTLDDIENVWHGEVADRKPALYSVMDSAELSHGKQMKCYLIFMAVRLLEMRRVLKNTGSIYLGIIYQSDQN